MKIKLVHNEIFICEYSKILKSMNIHFNIFRTINKFELGVVPATKDKELITTVKPV